ncbi:MAG TPA: ATP-binding protein [Actinomycetes bacterium]|nr:ATP-binding protein [Actinomycetes bacterium]
MASSEPASAVVHLAFPPEPALLGTVRLVVGIVARKAGVDEEGVEDLKVAVSETCAVAVGDLTWAGLSTPIELDLVEEPGRLGVEVRDRAPAGEHASSMPEDGEVDDRQFGLALVGALVDGLHSTTLEGGGHSTRFWLRRGREELPPPRA